MIPTIYENIKLDTKQQPSRTYKIDFNHKRIYGMIDNKLEAIKQAIYKILLTERYAYLIYDWFYGVGLEQYIGKNFDYIKADIFSTVKAALLYDDRILSVDNISVERGLKVDEIRIRFTVTTTEGILSDFVEVKNVG